MSEPTTLSRPSREKVDAVCAAATALALEAAQEAAGEASLVGEPMGVEAVGERSALHRFGTTHPGYPGWSWCVALSRAPRAKNATVDEVWLEPGGTAVLAPEWTPWSERVRPGDLGPGDVYPTAADDIRLVPGFTGADDLEGEATDEPLRPVGWELGLGRLRVLSAEGRIDAADRWAGGDTGPASPMAKAAPAMCTSCGWLLTIGGPLGQGFGICANEMSPADGRAVAFDYGCGAHSEVAADTSAVVVIGTIVDEVGFDAVELLPASDSEVPVLVQDVVVDDAVLAEVDLQVVDLQEVDVEEDDVEVVGVVDQDESADDASGDDASGDDVSGDADPDAASR